ncbi:hypothetical protein DAEQUDRAFT_387964 [Daedalea quercina L-15889]|uniref:Uncharacterized protein n=1 Tax=Daedalea quercina L-15889 TaxID=1314783 RepID=A0A165NYD7_9APHY|nr:hypothetical protein DAEQUDRAFT_387964 [Daedalea quercina L-15889]
MWNATIVTRATMSSGPTERAPITSARQRSHIRAYIRLCIRLPLRYASYASIQVHANAWMQTGGGVITWTDGNGPPALATPNSTPALADTPSHPSSATDPSHSQCVALLSSSFSPLRPVRLAQRQSRRCPSLCGWRTCTARQRPSIQTNPVYPGTHPGTPSQRQGLLDPPSLRSVD